MNYYIHAKKRFLGILILMKLIVLLILAFSLTASAGALAQKVTLRVENAALSNVLRTVREQTGFSIVYNPAFLREARPVSVDVRDREILDALPLIFQGQPFTYTVSGKVVTIVPSAASSRPGRHPERSAAESNGSLLILAFPEVRGLVVDSLGQPLSGASIRVLDAQGQRTSLQTQTDRNGEFLLRNVPEDARLEISYIGYVGQQIKATANVGVIVLAALSSTLEEITINKGYYSTTKTLNTGSVSSVKAEDIARQPISDPILMLQGRIPGLMVQQLNGVPGRQNRIRLRGQNSMENGNDPLFIVDGVQYNSTPLNRSEAQFTVGGLASPFNYLNPNDIESIDVLKDADATSLYGSRGANGVILITTKKGKEGKTNFDVGVYTGFSQIDKRVKFMNTQEYLAMRRQAFANDNVSAGPSDFDLNGTWDQNRYTDWQDVLIGGSAPMTESSANLSGGGKTTTFRIGGTYRKEGTIFPGDYSTSKASGHFNLSHRTLDNKLSALLSGFYVNNINNLPVGGLTLENDIGLPPNAPELYNSDGSLNWENSTWFNPLAVYERTASEQTNNLVSNLLVGYKILENLEVKSSFGFNTMTLNQTNLVPITAFDPTMVAFNPALFRSHMILKNQINNWIVEPQVTYSTSILGGKLESLIGTTFQSTKGDYLNLMSNGFQTDAQLSNITSAMHLRAIQSGNEYKYNAIYGRIGYSYLERYVFNFTARRDGSSRFGTGRRFGNFGSAAAAWIFSEEEFIKRVGNWLSFGKFRVSYGTTGNDQIGDYNYLDTYTPNAYLYQGNPGMLPTQLTNPFYGWEQVNKFEAGLEFGVLKDRLYFNANYYQNRTKNQLVQYGLPSVAGFTAVRANIPAVLQNSGIELSIASINIDNGDFHWSTNFNITIPKNKLIRYDNIEASSYARKYVVGMPLNLFYRYRYGGKDISTNDYTFVDINKDGAITVLQDQVPIFIGQKYFGGIQNNFKFKDIELDFFVQFTKQNGDSYFINGLPRGFLINQPIFSGYEEFTQNLTTNNDDLNTRKVNFFESDGIVKDASFVSLKNISLSYGIPFESRKRRMLKSARIFFQGQNLFTISNYIGFNPEAPHRNIVLPLLRTYTFGFRAAF